MVHEWRAVQNANRLESYKNMWMWIVRYKCQYSNYPLPEDEVFVRHIYIRGKHALQLVDDYDELEGNPDHEDAELLNPQPWPPRNTSTARMPTKKSTKRRMK